MPKPIPTVIKFTKCTRPGCRGQMRFLGYQTDYGRPYLAYQCLLCGHKHRLLLSQPGTG
jgi:hypothetical protein